MRKFRKKPVIIEAFQFHSVTENFVKWADAIGFNDWSLIENVQEKVAKVLPPAKTGQVTRAQAIKAVKAALAKEKHTTILIPTLEGVMTVLPGDWIIKGVNGEFYPCKPDIFDKTYEYVD